MSKGAALRIPYRYKRGRFMSEKNAYGGASCPFFKKTIDSHVMVGIMVVMSSRNKHPWRSKSGMKNLYAIKI
jgi:hypothetical protein